MDSDTRHPPSIEPSVLRLTQPTQSARVLARRLVLVALVLMAVLALAPWQQSLPGHGRVIAYAPLDRQQALEAPMDGRVVEWMVEEGSHVAAGDPIARIADNDPDILARIERERSLEQAEWMGNPVRAEIAAVLPPDERMAGRSGPLRVLVVGGSLGAAVLNETVPQALLRLPADQRPLVVHQAGERQIEALRAAYARAQVDGELRPFIDDMAAAYADADLVICRAGALTVAELAAAGVASLLVPFPYAVDDHQTGIARFLADRGGAYLLPQSELTPDRLAGILSSLDRGRLLHMAENACELSKPLAAVAVAHVCAELGGGEQA